jgi:hypothetical protein
VIFFLPPQGGGTERVVWPLQRCRILPDLNKQETAMPFRRGGFALTPPSVIVFVISLVLAVLAMLVHYAHVSVPIINASRVFDVLTIAYVVLMVGVLFRGV